MRKVNLVVTGKVQGVFYRHYAKKEADKLRIKGWCQNRENGSVHIVAIGQDSDIDKFIEWTKNGTSLAKVRKVEISEESFENFEGEFEIR
jgi:acylphosphatase